MSGMEVRHSNIGGGQQIHKDNNGLSSRALMKDPEEDVVNDEENLTLAEMTRKNNLQADCKTELSKLCQISESIGKVTPLIFDEDDVVLHLLSIEEFYDELGDDLNEVLIYMVALIEHF